MVMTVRRNTIIVDKIPCSVVVHQTVRCHITEVVLLLLLH
jgi:hypothetical protein